MAGRPFSKKVRDRIPSDIASLGRLRMAFAIDDSIPSEHAQPIMKEIDRLIALLRRYVDNEAIAE